MVVISVYHHQPSLPTPILELTYQCHTSRYAFDKCRIFKVRRPRRQGFGVVNTGRFQLQQSRPPGQDFTIELSEHGVVARARAVAVDDHVFPVGPGTVIDFGQITELAQGTRTVGERGKGLPAQFGLTGAPHTRKSAN